MEPKGLEGHIGNLSVRLEIFFGPQKSTKNKNIYKEKRIWTKPLVVLEVFLMFIGCVYRQYVPRF